MMIVYSKARFAEAIYVSFRILAQQIPTASTKAKRAAVACVQM
jgi:hypothetical protein